VDGAASQLFRPFGCGAGSNDRTALRYDIADIAAPRYAAPIFF
jgi:hypothetical protein